MKYNLDLLKQKISKYLLNLSFRKKILILFVGVTSLVIFVLLIFVSFEFKTRSVDAAIEKMNATAEKNALSIQNDLEINLYTTRSLSQVCKENKYLNDSLFPYLKRLYSNILGNNPNILSVWDSWEMKFLDPSYPKDYGRFRVVVWRNSGAIQAITDTIYKTDSPDYAWLKKEKTESLEEPYFDSYDNDPSQQVLMTSLVVPNIIDDKFAGVVGVDIPLTYYYDYIRTLTPYKGSYAILLSSKMKFIAHPDKDLIGEDALVYYGNFFEKENLQEKVANATGGFFEDKDANGKNWFVSYKPITVGNCPQAWSLVVFVPKSVVLNESTSVFWKTLILGIIAIILIILLVLYFSDIFVLKPIGAVSQMLLRLSKGHISHEMKVSAKSSDELGNMANFLNLTVDGLANKVEFAEEIGKGNYNATIQVLSNDDVLGESLINMAKNLQRAKEEEEKRHEEEEKRQWSNQGLANFSEILRQYNHDLELLGSNILSNLVNYLGAIQGGLFILNNDDAAKPYFQLLAAYAYNRKKFIEKQIAIGEGLVGTCAIEKQTIYLEQVPENYITISSGLGEAKPRSLLIVPLKVEENVLGVIELASFNKFEKYKIEFVEQIGLSIAQTITSVQTNIQTTELLERTQQQAEEMKAQEEEVRQNLEELATIKEELEKRNEEMQENQNALSWEKTLLDSLLNYLPDKIYFKDLKSRFIKASKSTLRFFGMEKEAELMGKSDFDFFDEEHARPAYEDEQRIIRTDTPVIGIVEKETMADGRFTWAETSKLPLKTENGEIIGTFGITRDITASKLMEEEISLKDENVSAIQHDLEKKVAENKALFEAISNSTYVIEYTPDGYVSFINDAYLKLLNIQAADIIGKHHSFQIDFTEDQRNKYKQFWGNLNNGMIQQETYKFTLNDKTYLFYETYTPVKDANGKVYKILKIAVNISHLLNDNNADNSGK